MKIFGIPVKIEASFLLVLVMAMGRSADLLLILEWGVVVFISILIHELGHAIAGRAFGLIPDIKLYAMGGLTSWADGRKEITPAQSILISLAGPLSGLLLGGLVFLLQPAFLMNTDLMHIAYTDLLWVNIGWSLFNLLPVLPLDGGHVIESLEEWFRRKRENLVATMISLAVAIIVFIWAFSVRYSWIAFLTGWFAWLNASTLLQRFRHRLDLPLQVKIESAREALTNRNGKAVLELSEEVFQKSKSEQLKATALEFIIYGNIFEKDFAEAEKRLRQYKALFGANLYMEGYLCYSQGEFERAIQFFKLVLEKEGSYGSAELLFYALIKADRFDEAFQLCSHPILEKQAVNFYLKLQSEAFESNRIELAVRLGQEAFKLSSDATLAYNTGCAFARQHNLKEAFHWVSLAVQVGFDQKELLESDPDLAELRELPEFKRLYQSMPDQEIATT